MTNETLDESNDQNDLKVEMIGSDTRDDLPKKEPVPLHDCDLCDDKLVACKHSVPVHIPPTTLVRGKAGLEDFYNKVNENTELMKLVLEKLSIQPKKS